MITVAGLLISSTAPVFAQNGEKTIFRDLPEAVKKTVLTQKGHRDVRKIEKFTHDGKTIYEVRIDRKQGADKVVFIGEDGSLVTDTAIVNHQNSTARMQLKDLPLSVQETFKKEAPTGKITDIDLNTASGKTVYEIKYTRANQASEILINEDGSINREQLSRSNDFKGNRTSENSINNSNPKGGQVGFDRPLAATQKMDFDALPQAAKRTARDHAGSNRIEDVERGTLDGKTVYEIAFKSEGQHHELRLAEDGSVVQEIAGTNIRFPGALTVDEVPKPVRNAIRQQIGSGEVNDIDKMTIGGKTVYEVGFKKEKGGAQHELRIAEDGTVLGEPAGAQKK